MKGKKGVTPQGIWLAKHWGLVVGSVMGFGGLCLAVPGNMVSWRVYQQTSKIIGMEYTYTITDYVRSGEPVLSGDKFVGVLPDSHETKGLGASLMLLGSTVLFMSANSLKKEYERLEITNWAIRESEFNLTDHEYGQSVEVDRYAIDLQYQQQISNMLNPPVSYYPLDDIQDQPKLKAEPEFSRTTTGFLAWLQQKAEKTGLTSFDMNWLGSQSFAGKKPTKDEVTAWVDELVVVEQAEWLDEGKKNFRLLNG